MYDNILKYVGAPSDNGLSYEKQAKNYEIFSDLMKKGVDLQELVDKANAPKEPSMDESLFKVMEDAVKDNEDIKTARTTLGAIKSSIIMQICMSDKRFSDAYKDYKDKVVKAYTEKKDTEGKKV